MVADFKKNKNTKNALSGFLFKLGVVLVLIIIVLLIIANVKIYQKKKRLILQIKSLQSKIENLKSQNNSLNEGISNADDKDYIEKVAREELDLQKPGEKVVSFITTYKDTESNIKIKKGILEIWLDWLGNFFKN